MEISPLDKILKNGRGMLLAYDHGFEHGPEDFDERSVDPAWIMELADSGYFTGVVCQKGIAAKYYVSGKSNVPLIVKLNGKTAFHKDEEPISLQNCTVEEAVNLGAVGVGYTIYVGSEHEQEMITEFAKIEKEAHEKGLLVIGWMYPRGKHIDSTSPLRQSSGLRGASRVGKITAYAARLGLELNTDAVKIKYTGDVESFKKVVAAAGKAKVFVVGGPKTETPEDVYQMAREVIEAGAVGLVVGRNVWQADNPLEVAQKLSEIVYR